MARRWWAMVLVLALMGCANSVPGRTAAPRQSSTSGPKSTTTSRRPTPVLDWKSCDAGECATLPVPEDYRKPNGTTIDLAVARSSKARDGQRIGSLVVNLRTGLPPCDREPGYGETGTGPFPENEPNKMLCHFIAMTKAL